MTITSTVPPAATAAPVMPRPAWADTLAIAPFDDGVISVVASTTPIPIGCETVTTDWDPAAGGLALTVRTYNYLTATRDGLTPEDARETHIVLGGLTFTPAQWRALVIRAEDLLAQAEEG